MLPLPPNGKRYKQGIYKPIHPEKYVGEQPIRYLSSLELSFLLFCDRSTSVIEYSSESIIIPYLNPLTNKVSRYYVDSYIKIKEGNTIKKYLIEIKPKKQTQQPIFSPRQKEKTKIYEVRQWAQNQAKWDAAKRWCDQKNKEISPTNKNIPIDFMILTEENLR